VSGVEDPVAAFGTALIDRAEQVAAAEHLPVQGFDFGPIRLGLQVAGGRYAARLTRAIGFAAAEAAPESLRIVALDGVASGLGAPPDWHFPVTRQSHLERLHERPDLGLTLRFDPGTQTWRVLSAHRRLAAIWTADAALLPEWEDSAPLRDVLHWHAASSGPALMLHAAAIGPGSAGVLLAGPGGSGKSTTTAAAVRAGWLTTGDDFVLIDPGGPRAHGLYDSIKLGPESLDLVPEFRAAIGNPDRPADQKARIHLGEAWPERYARALDLKALLLPVVTGAARSRILPAGPGEGMRALVPTTVFLLRGASASVMTKSTALLRRLPSYRLELGRDPAEAVAAIGAFLAEHGT
jgi:hypothetical protein